MSAISQMKIYGPFIFMEGTVTGMTYLDMPQQWLILQLDDDSNDYLFQQDGAPPHYNNEVRRYLLVNEHLPHHWIGRATANDLAFRNLATRSPDLTPCDFFVWGYVKDAMYVSPLSQDLPELRQRIATGIETIDVEMLSRVWQELDYRLDICCVKRGSHIESL
jgi:hypothetical protein